MTDKNLIMGRSFYYEFFAMPFFFSETDEKFQIWKKQIRIFYTYFFAILSILGVYP